MYNSCAKKRIQSLKRIQSFSVFKTLICEVKYLMKKKCIMIWGKQITIFNNFHNFGD